MTIQSLEARRLLTAGFPDLTFGDNGAVAIPGEAGDIVVQPDGRPIVNVETAVGDSILQRLTSTGAIDTTFGVNGVFSLDGEIFRQLHANPDGTILFRTDQRIGRLAIDGKLDRSFGGTDGSFPIRSEDRFTVDRLGRILTFNHEFVRRHHVDGRPDLRWDNDGITRVYSRTDLPPEGGISQVVVQPSGRVIALAVWNITSDSRAQFVAVSPRGKIDRSFGDNGFAEAAGFGATDLVTDSNGALFLTNSSSESQVHLQRYSSDGARDTNFAENNPLGLLFSGDFQFDLAEMLLQDDDKIILVGNGDRQDETTFLPGIMVYRLNTDGSLDSSFRYDGRIEFDHNNGAYLETFHAAFDPTGNLLVTTRQGGFQKFPGGFDVWKLGLTGGSPALFSVSSTGTLRVTGTKAADDIRLSRGQNAGEITVRFNEDQQTATGALRIVVDAGGRDDLIEVDTPLRSTLIGAAGHDVLRLSGRGVLSGGGGHDTLSGNRATQLFHGGEGSDVIVYDAFTAPLQISLDNVANDGLPGENDNVFSTIENVFGGSGDDVLIGSNTNNNLHGFGGNDTLRGNNGRDVLYGGDGQDDLFFDFEDTLFPDD